MRQLYRSLPVLGVAVLLVATAATAAIISITGEILEIPAPASVLVGDLESETVMYLFAEKQDHVLSQNINVDMSAPGTVTDILHLTPATIGVGTTVSSHLLHHDRFLNPGGVGNRMRGSITFDRDILGVMTERESLIGSDAEVGNVGTAYESHADVPARGTEYNDLGTGDTLTVSADRRTITVSMYVGVSATALDEIRILTEAEKVVPTRTSTWGRIKSILDRK